jgi:hypothetical protein
VTSRVAGIVVFVAGLATAGLPFLVWYSVDTPRGLVTSTGVDATAELWSLVALGGLIAVAGGLAITGRWSAETVVFVAMAAAEAAR